MARLPENHPIFDIREDKFADKDIYDEIRVLAEKINEFRNLLVIGINDIPIGIDDHGNLLGLGDDDHSQYYNETRLDLKLASPPEIGGTVPAAGNFTDLTLSGNLTMADTKWIGFSGGGRISFEAEGAGTDEINFLSCNVAIGTATPFANRKLHVKGSSIVGTLLEDTSAAGSLVDIKSGNAAAGYVGVRFINSADAARSMVGHDLSNDNFVIALSQGSIATPWIAIDRTTGNVGLGGISSPSELLDLSGGTLVFTGGSGGLPFGEIYAYDSATTITITAAGIANKVQITAFDTNGQSNDTTPDHTSDHITITKAGVYLVTVSISPESVAAGGADEFGFAVFKNNGATLFPNLHSHRELAGGGGDTGSVSLSGLIDAAVNDTIEVWCWNEDSTNNIVIDDINLLVVMVGG